MICHSFCVDLMQFLIFKYPVYINSDFGVLIFIITYLYYQKKGVQTEFTSISN